MNGVDGALQDFARLDLLARGDTWVHRVDSRAKTLVTLFYVIIVASLPARAVIELLPLLAYPLVLFLAARLPLGILLRPLAVALLLALLIGIANPWVDRQPVRLAPGIQIAGGWLSLASILLRTVLCVAAAIVLMATTGMERLCQGLLRLGVPRTVVVQMLFLYRYLFLLGANVQSMSRARALRAAGRPLRLATFGPLIGHLLLRTLDRAERIYQAMCCRGFRDKVPIGGWRRFGWGDATFLVGWCACLAGLRWYLPMENLGGWILGVVG